MFFQKRGEVSAILDLPEQKKLNFNPNFVATERGGGDFAHSGSSSSEKFGASESTRRGIEKLQKTEKKYLLAGSRK